MTPNNDNNNDNNISVDMDQNSINNVVPIRPKFQQIDSHSESNIKFRQKHRNINKNAIYVSDVSTTDNNNHNIIPIINVSDNESFNDDETKDNSTNNIDEQQHSFDENNKIKSNKGNRNSIHYKDIKSNSSMDNIRITIHSSVDSNQSFNSTKPSNNKSINTPSVELSQKL